MNSVSIIATYHDSEIRFTHNRGGEVEITAPNGASFRIASHQLLGAATAMHTLAEASRPIEAKETADWIEHERIKREARR